MKVNEQNTKEMLIYFGTQVDTKAIPNIFIHGKDIERVEHFKLLGIIISADLLGMHILFTEQSSQAQSLS